MKRQKLLTAFTLTCLFIPSAIGVSIIFQPFSGQSGLARAQTAASPTHVPTPSSGHHSIEDQSILKEIEFHSHARNGFELEPPHRKC